MIKIRNHEYKSGYTHAGKFHADEVAATALLLMLDPGFKIERGYSPPMDKRDVLVYDIGNSRYDHHTYPYEHRANNVKYSSVGKIWRDLGDQFGLSENQKNMFDFCVIQPIDINDNNGDSNPFSTLIGAMNINWNDNTMENNHRFMEAVDVCKRLFAGWLQRALSENEAYSVASGIADDSPYEDIVVCHSYIPSECFPDTIRFVISPSLRGGWQAMARRGGVQFPEEWRGSFQLPKGVTFCHAGGFIACFEDEETAVEYCRQICSSLAA